MEFCKWIFRKQISNNRWIYISGCNCDKRKFNDLREFKYCPYCGKKIEIECK